MGMDQTVSFTGKPTPPWPAVSDLLARHGFPVQSRMIDGQLAFPDEVPPDDWKELRVGTPQGMVTLRRGADSIVFVTWGNADAALRQAWNAVTWAFAETSAGTVDGPQGPVDANTFRRQAEMPATLR
jgi:hypothetical protein